jgi:cell wall-associated NlpC family hydrolase
MLCVKNVRVIILLLGIGLLVFESCSTSSSHRDHTVNRGARSKTKSTYHRPPSNVAKVKSSSSTPSTARTMIMQRNQVVDFASRFKGSKYQYGGKTPESGFDCSGLIYYTFRHYNYHMQAGSVSQSKLGQKISLSNTKAGDLLFFGHGGKVNHVALVAHNSGKSLLMLHSTTNGGVIEEDFYKSDYWKRRFLFARDYLSTSSPSGHAQR